MDFLDNGAWIMAGVLINSERSHYWGTFMRLMPGLIAIAVALLPGMAGARPVPSLQAKNNCVEDKGSCVHLSAASVGAMVQDLSFDAPARGQVLVSVTGSGVCANFGTAANEVADFTTEIVDDPNTQPVYTGPGGNRFEFTLPANVNNSGNGVFNLASQRVFAVRSGHLHYYLPLAINRLDEDVQCDIVSVSMNALFLPQ
jgi:hypothetical protein